MKLVFLFGNSAVGKMTVGQELAKITSFRLFHNHMIIEPVLQVFGYFNGRAIERMRNIVFEEFIESECAGLIFTYMWAFDQPEDWAYIERVKKIFQKKSIDFYYVELVASQEVRLQRNRTENRLKHKASKRNIEISDQRLIRYDEQYRLESYPGEIPFEHYTKIDNTNLSAQKVAHMIKETFHL